MKKGIKTLVITSSIIAGIAIIYIALIALGVNQFREEYRISDNALDAIINELQYKKIIAIGEHHDRVNEELFLADNIQALYNAGVRYIFLEGGTPLNEGYLFLMFYPWMYSGWRYESNALYQAITDFNKNLRSEDKIEIISPEKNAPDNITDPRQFWQYRDTSAAETIIEIMDNVSNETKAIIIYGDAHTVTYPYKYFHPGFRVNIDWQPLGCLLRNHYGNNFLSINYVTVNDTDPIIRQKYLLNESKLVFNKNISFTNIPFLKNMLKIFPAWTFYNRHEGNIIESESIQGTYYQYNPTNENLSFLFKIAEDYALEYQKSKYGDSGYIPKEFDTEITRGIDYLKSQL